MATTTTRDRIIELASLGFTNIQIASACGVTESRISQLISEPEVAQEIALKQYTTLQAQSTRDALKDSLLDMALDKVQQTMPFISKPLEAVRAAEILDKLKRYTTPQTAEAPSQVVQITLPACVTLNYTAKVDSFNNVVAVGDKELVTMQSSALATMMESQNDTLSKEDRIELAKL